MSDCKHLAVTRYDNLCRQWPDRVKHINDDYRAAVCQTYKRKQCVWLHTVNPETQQEQEQDLFPGAGALDVVGLASYSLRQLSRVLGHHGSEHIVRAWVHRQWIASVRAKRDGSPLLSTLVSREDLLRFVAEEQRAWPYYQVDRIVDPEIRAVAYRARITSPLGVAALSLTPTPAGAQRHGIDWSDADDRRLLHLRSEGLTWDAIAHHIGHSVTACRNRYGRLQKTTAGAA